MKGKVPPGKKVEEKEKKVEEKEEKKVVKKKTSSPAENARREQRKANIQKVKDYREKLFDARRNIKSWKDLTFSMEDAVFPSSPIPGFHFTKYLTPGMFDKYFFPLQELLLTANASPLFLYTHASEIPDNFRQALGDISYLYVENVNPSISTPFLSFPEEKEVKVHNIGDFYHFRYREIGSTVLGKTLVLPANTLMTLEETFLKKYEFKVSSKNTTCFPCTLMNGTEVPQKYTGNIPLPYLSGVFQGIVAIYF